eukprot:6214498-Pleurochrysis_carterae.AAC.7
MSRRSLELRELDSLGKALWQVGVLELVEERALLAATEGHLYARHTAHPARPVYSAGGKLWRENESEPDKAGTVLKSLSRWNQNGISH